MPATRVAWPVPVKLTLRARSLPPLARTPPSPGTQPASSRISAALAGSWSGRFGPTGSASRQGFGGRVIRPVDGWPLPPVATSDRALRSTAVTSASRTAGSAPGWPAPSLNQTSPAVLVLSMLSSPSGTRAASGPATVARFSSPDRSRLAMVVWLSMTRTVTDSGTPTPSIVWPSGPQAYSSRGAKV